MFRPKLLPFGLLVLSLSIVIVVIVTTATIECNKQDVKNVQVKNDEQEQHHRRYKRKIVHLTDDLQAADDSHGSETGFRSVVLHDESRNNSSNNNNNNNNNNAAYSVAHFQQYHDHDHHDHHSTPTRVIGDGEEVVVGRFSTEQQQQQLLDEESSTEHLIDQRDNSFNERGVNNENQDGGEYTTVVAYSQQQQAAEEEIIKRQKTKPKYERKSRYKSKSDLKRNRDKFNVAAATAAGGGAVETSSPSSSSIAAEDRDTVVEVNKNAAWTRLTPNVEISASLDGNGFGEKKSDEQSFLPAGKETTAAVKKVYKKRKNTTYWKNGVPTNDVQQNALYFATNFRDENLSGYFGGGGGGVAGGGGGGGRGSGEEDKSSSISSDEAFDHNYVLQRSNKFDVEDAMIGSKDLFVRNPEEEVADDFDYYRTASSTPQPNPKAVPMQSSSPRNDYRQQQQDNPKTNQFDGNNNHQENDNNYNKEFDHQRNYQYYGGNGGADLGGPFYKTLPPFTLKPEGIAAPYVTHQQHQQGDYPTAATGDNYVYNPYLPHLGYFPKGYIRNVEFEDGKEKKSMPAIVIPLTKDMMNSNGIYNSPYLIVYDNFQNPYVAGPNGNSNHYFVKSTPAPSFYQPIEPYLGDHHFGLRYPYAASEGGQQHNQLNQLKSSTPTTTKLAKPMLDHDYHRQNHYNHHHANPSHDKKMPFHLSGAGHPPSSGSRHYLSSSSVVTPRQQHYRPAAQLIAHRENYSGGPQHQQQQQQQSVQNGSSKIQQQQLVKKVSSSNNNNMDIRQNKIQHSSSGGSGSPYGKSYSNDYSNRRVSSHYKSHNSEISENELFTMDY